jgi:hypothetical protein
MLVLASFSPRVHPCYAIHAVSNQIFSALIAQTAIIVAGAVVVILYNNARFTALDKRIDDSKLGPVARIEGLDKRFSEKIDGVDAKLTAKIDGVDKRLDLTNKRIDDLRAEVIERIERLEHPVTRP